MEYLQASIKEALRLHPATGLPLARVVPEGGATLSGTYFPAGVSYSWLERSSLASEDLAVLLQYGANLHV